VGGGQESKRGVQVVLGDGSIGSLVGPDGILDAKHRCPLAETGNVGTGLVMSLFMAGVLANISVCAPEPARMTLWQSLRTVRSRSKNRRTSRPDVLVVVEAR
jgi:hypothetical protein